MISYLTKRFWVFILLLGSSSLAFAQSTFVEVHSTPYDRQMSRIEPTLVARRGHCVQGLSFTLVNSWMIELRSMPYHYSRLWLTPAEVEMVKAADCKGKAVALYERMQLNGARNLRLIIGKRRATDWLTHAWLEWDTGIGTLLLDPTFNWNAAYKLRNPHSYIAFYGYAGAHKYEATNSLLARHTTGVPNPAAPAHGVITRPNRIHSNPVLRNTIAVDSGLLFKRTLF